MSGIGNHTLGKSMLGLRAMVNSGFNSMFFGATKSYDAAKPYDVDGVTVDSVPKTPLNPWRKRPVRLVYRETDFQSFRMPSEKSFLLGAYDYNELFGKRKNTDHSPQIRTQIDLDTNLCLLMFGTTLTLLFWEVGRTHKYDTLKQNMSEAEMGKFKAEDFN